MRLDVFIAESGLAKSRTDAKNFILGGHVRVDGKMVVKPSLEVSPEERVEVDTSSKKYVSRGGLKLEAALDAFMIDPRGKRCIDVGASSGGFTDCLLQRGAASVVAVDSGSGQMAESLRRDSRVVTVENYNARYMKGEDVGGDFELAVMDVSFISATYIIGALRGVLVAGADFVLLVKPQFEVGRASLGKGGIVKDEKARLSALKKVVDFAGENGFSVLGSIKSPEFLVHFKAR